VRAAQAALGGERVDADEARRFRLGIREHQDAYFGGPAPLWRISTPSTAAPLHLEGEQMIEWGGALRWIRSPQPAQTIRARAQALGGHATLFRGGERAQVFTPLTPALATIHRRLKAEFDPAGIFNPGRMYAEW
jgi:glycolate oxidase FAD binding subunit